MPCWDTRVLVHSPTGKESRNTLYLECHVLYVVFTSNSTLIGYKMKRRHFLLNKVTLGSLETVNSRH